MGKQASKHAYRGKEPPDAECFLINGQFNKALEEQILKQTKTGFNLANYNLDTSLSELSVSLENKGGSIPLRVELPPQKMDTENPKVLELGQDMEKPQLNIEEFECGVQFEGLEKNKQEWSFTLYDFDGHGKITREDLSSLLKALYDAVGSSIKIPSNGTKTLKLRLTVGQDNTQLPENKSPTKSKKDKPSKDSEKVKDSPKSKEFAKLNNNLTATHVQLPAKQCNSDLQERVKGQCQNSCQVKGHNPCTAQGQDFLCSGSKRIQLTTQERQQLVELVQENMERNHVKQLRRHHSDCRGTTTHDHSHHKRRHRVHCSNVATCNNQTSNNITAPATTTTSNNNNNNNSSTIQEERAKECQDRRNYYLDLAGIEHNAKTQPSQNLNNSVGQSARPGEHSPRSKSQDTKKCDNLQRESQRIKQQHLDSVKSEHLRSRSFDPQEVETRSPKGHHKGSPHKHGRFRPVSLPVHVPDSMSHHHRRHRHRDKDHDLAMQQVAEWIEREHACDIDGDKIVVQKHEHHHIHEHHHHHHYHHYYEA